MSQGFSARFTNEEMEAIRKSLRDEAKFGTEFMARLRRVAKRIPFAEDLMAAWFCARDPATPRRVRLTLLAALGYFVLPADTIPDIIFGLGFTDDIAVLTAAITAVQAHIKPAHRAAAKAALEAN
jgi:uncharacterized membrane protein YkvA (DUF1232 family)